MRIAVDVRELCGRPTGVGRYVSELLQEWDTSADARRHEWRLYAHDTPNVPPAYSERVRVLRGGRGTLWEQWTFGRALAWDRPDVLFAPGYTAPLSAPCPIALAVHDVSFAAHPGWFSAREGLRRRVLTRWAARRAKVVLTLSNFSRDEITRHLRISADRIRVIPLGMRAVSSHAQHPRGPLVLYVGSIFARRHVDILLQTFLTEVAPVVTDARLAIVGDNRTHPRIDLEHQLKQAPEQVRARVALRNYVDDDQLGQLYATASVFVFLSEYEGFGLTPLEALAAGVPPVVLDTPIAREIYGPAAHYLPLSPELPRALGNTLVELLRHEAAREAILRRAPDVLARYRWKRAAADTLRAIEEAAGV
jgi:glycosyltransferase involved in cell wall biosynthesis